MLGVFLLAVIELSGVTGSRLTSRAFFDAHNVKVGDPLILTVDFIGDADFSALHPPRLSKMVSAKDWKVDDASAKTDTYRDARRLTYRVRPMREGVLYFPAVEFSYTTPQGAKAIVRANEIPVHAKRASNVVVEGMDEDFDAMPSPAALIVELGKEPWGVKVQSLGDDELFAWKKACSKPTADAFAQFSFPEAKLNEARCALVAGEWSRAMQIYRKLEWRIGQTEEIERGIVSALALKYENPAVELPVWRQVMRPLLRFAWLGRVLCVIAALLIILLLSRVFAKVVKLFASLSLIVLTLVPLQSSAEDMFDMMERQMQEMRKQIDMMDGELSPFSFSRQPPVKIKARAQALSSRPMVGEVFEFVISIESPKRVTLSDIRITPSETYSLKIAGKPRNLQDETAGSNVVKRIAIPVRYDAPLKGKIHFTVLGSVSSASSRGNGMMQFSFPRTFRTATSPIDFEVAPLPTVGQPSDFSGLVSEGLRFHEMCDILKVETNDVVCITYRLYPNNAHVPENFLPPDSAFEMARDPKGKYIDYRRFYVADGAEKTPIVSIPYYDPRSKAYHRVETGGTRLTYVPAE